MSRLSQMRRREFLKEGLSVTVTLTLGRSLVAAANPPLASNSTADGKAEFEVGRHSVSPQHPRLLGSLEDLRGFARNRAPEYERVRRVARDEATDDYAWIISGGLVAAIDGDHVLGRKVQQRAMKMVLGPIRVGHTPFGTDLALAGLAFDLCRGAWSDADAAKLCDYINRTVDGNVDSELMVFHNAWYGYKHGGIGLACYATYHENPRAPAILRALEHDYATRAAPALEMAGDGGGWAEGYYIHYWLYEWLFFCEVARRCEGLDYFALAPSFYQNRAVASMFETYPGLGEYNSRRCIPMGDGGGRRFGGDRDKALNARRLLVNYFRDDPRHRSVHGFNEATPRCAVGAYAYKDFLWRDTSVPQRDMRDFPLSHVSRGPGFVYARSSWEDDATYFFFKCGDRFTAHQHLDVNHFLIYKHAELAGDGGHYDAFGTDHDVNYHLRSIAHNTVLVQDPDETWPAIRASMVTANDGGQHHAWKHHNGAVSDPADWLRQKDQLDIADLVACEDHGRYLYVAGDATGAFARRKLRLFTRQIVFLRPNTFVLFDRVIATRPEFRKTWLLQAMAVPERKDSHLVITNGPGRLFVQALMPLHPDVKLISGEDLYRVGSRSYPPRQDTGPAPQCRVEISPSEAADEDFFLIVLTAASAHTQNVPLAKAERNGTRLVVTLDEVRLNFRTDRLALEM
jgi:hypothetical protein